MLMSSTSIIYGLFMNKKLILISFIVISIYGMDYGSKLDPKLEQLSSQKHIKLNDTMVDLLEQQYGHAVPAPILYNLLLNSHTPYAQYNANKLLATSTHQTKQAIKRNPKRDAQLAEAHNEFVSKIKAIYKKNNPVNEAQKLRKKRFEISTTLTQGTREQRNTADLLAHYGIPDELITSIPAEELDALEAILRSQQQNR